MLHRLHSRHGGSALAALLEGDLLFFKANEDDDSGAGGSGSGGSSQGDDEDADDDDDASGDDDSDSGSNEAKLKSEEAKKYRLRAKKAEQEAKEAKERLAKLEGASLSEKERAEKERDEAVQRAAKAEAKVARIEIERKVTKVANKLGFEDPDVIMAMAESGRVPDLDLEDDPDEDEVASALGALAKAKPRLLRDDSSTDEGDSQSRNGKGAGTNRPRQDRTAEAIDKLPPQQRAHARLMHAFGSKK